MPHLAIALEEQIDEIYRESHPLWGAGLDYDNYRGLWRELSETEWARRYVRFLVWTDDGGRVLSSMKLYRPLVRFDGRVTRASVLGAVFTPRAERNRGHAAQMVQAAVREAADRGEGLALLFSDIGMALYASVGFRPLPAHEHWGRIPAGAGDPAPGFELREMEGPDLESISRAHAAFCERQPIAVLRETEHWHFLRVRADRFFARLGDPHIRQRHRIALRDGRFAGYLFTVEGGGEWNVREIGAIEGDPDIMATVLRLGAQRARSEGLRRFYGWLPPGLADRLDGWGIRSRPRTRALPMLLPLARATGAVEPQVPASAYLPFQDQF